MPDVARAPIRVLHVINSLEPGGAERLLLDVVRALDRGRVVPSIAYLLGHGSLLGTATPPCNVIRLGRGRLSPASLIHLGRVMRSGSYDILHTHDALSGVIARRVGRWTGIRSTVTTRHMPRLQGHHPWLYRMEDHALRASDAIVAISNAVAVAVREMDPSLASKVTVIPNAVDTEVFSPRDQLRDDNITVIGTVSRLVVEKDLGLLLRAVAILRSKGRAPKRVMIAGDGEEGAALRQLITALDLGGIVELVGSLVRAEDVCAFLRQIDLFVLPSREEGFGIAALEAMAVGLPVVCTRVGGLPELVHDGVSGVLVPSGDADATATAIDRLLQDSAGRRQMGVQGRARAVQEYGLTTYAERLTTLYEQVLGRR